MEIILREKPLYNGTWIIAVPT